MRSPTLRASSSRESRGSEPKTRAHRQPPGSADSVRMGLGREHKIAHFFSKLGPQSVWIRIGARQQKHKSIKHRRWRGECSQAEPGRLALPGARGASAAHGEQRLWPA